MDRWKKGKALFSGQKVTPEFLASQGKRKSALLKALSRAIKEVQLVYANQECRGESRDIGDCRPTQQLCAKFEELLRHGLKVGWFGVEGSFWPLVLKISRKQAIEYISSLQYAQTEGGKCRAWIRLAVNECSLESYIHILCHDSKLLSQYYESYSFLRDSEMMVALTQLLVGLSQINFNMTVDTASLEFGAAPEAVNQVQPALRLRVADIVSTPGEVVASKSRSKRGKSHSLRQSPASSQHLTVEDNSSVASGSSDEDRTHQSPTLSWTSGDMDTVGTEYQNDTGGIEYQNETSETELQNKTGVSEFGNGTGVSESGNGAGVSKSGNVTGVSESGNGTGVPESGNGTGEQQFPCDPVNATGEKGETEVQTTQLEAEFEETTKFEAEFDETTTLEAEFEETTRLEAEFEETTQLEAEFDLLTKQANQEPDPIDLPPTTPPLTTPSQPGLPSSLQQSPSPFPIPATSPSPMHIPAVSTRPLPLPIEPSKSPSPLSTSPVPSSRHSPPPEFSPPSQLTSPPKSPSPHQPSSPPFHPPESADSAKTAKDSNPFSIEKDGVFASAHASRNDDNPFTREETPGMENEKTSDSELESTLKRTNTNPFIHLSDLPPPLSNALNPFEEISTNPFDVPPPTSPTNPFTDDVIAISETTPSGAQDVGGAIEEGEESGWSEVSSTAADTLASLEETHCISISVFQQAKDSLSDLSSQYDKLSDLSSQFDKVSNLSSQFDKVSVGEELSRPGSEAKERASDIDTISSVPSSVDLSVLEEAELTDDNLRPQENYFENEMNEAELERAISKLKAKLLMGGGGGEDSPVTVEIRKRLVRLQTQRIKLKEMEEEPLERDYLEVNGHQFLRQRRQKTEVVCEGCTKKISKITLKPWSRCKKCQCCCHNACFTHLSLVCTASMHNSQAANRYILEVCPEVGLTHQSFRCASCNQAFNATSTNTSAAAARLCDYSGKYYCPACHHNSLALIPARVLHNWDFSPRKVCCRCYDLLERLYTKPLLRIDHVNTLLYTYVPNLSAIESLRRDVLYMMKYLDQCESAKESGLVKKLDPFPHFKDTAKQFSLSDLELIRDNHLLPQLKDIHKLFTSHIRQTCSYCYSRGSNCLVCGSGESLFPFDRQVKLCPHCKTLFHKTCYIELTSCPKCYRHRRTKT